MLSTLIVMPKEHVPDKSNKRRSYAIDPKADLITIQTGVPDEPSSLFGVKVNRRSSVAEVLFQLGKERYSPCKLIRAGQEIPFNSYTVVQQDDYLLIDAKPSRVD
jgi:hypothetical protein